jgi:hypothetical protein
LLFESRGRWSCGATPEPRPAATSVTAADARTKEN